jgi:hypothetical protein
MNGARRMVAAAALLALPFTLEAQGRRVLTGVEYRAMSFDDGLDSDTKNVTEMVVQLGLVWPVSRRLSFDLGTRYASASREGYARDSSGTVTGTVQSTVSGLTDTQARAVYQVMPDVMVFTVSANLPTGKSTIEEAQLGAVSAIAHDLIPYAVSSFGSGFSLTTGLAFAVPVGGWALGVGGAYRMSGTYRLLQGDDSTNYRAGAEMRMRVGLDRVVGQGRVALGVTYSSFSVDEIGDLSVLRPGKRYITQASYSFPIGNVGLSLYAWDLFRASGSEVQTNASVEAQNLLTLGTTATVQMGRSQLRPTLEYRSHAVEGAAGPSSMMSVNVRYVRPMGDRFVLMPSFRYDMGTITNDLGTGVGFGGMSAGLTLRANW